MKWLGKLFTYILILGLLGALAGVAAIFGIYRYLEPDLPDVEHIRDVQLQVPLRVYSRDRRLIAEFGEKRRDPVSFAEVPAHLVQAILSAEDSNFFTHPGVDIKGLLRAGVQLVLTGRRAQGGSTITMQVARNFYLSNEKTYTRKLSEIFLALRIERDLSKEEILELYLNKIYLGHRAYGVGAAAKVYYGKPLAQLSLAQTAMIAGLPKAPSAYNPLANPPRALERRNYVLRRMLELGYIDRAEHDQAVAAPISAAKYAAEIEADAPHLAEMVRDHMYQRFGEGAYTDGYEVHTSIDSRLQATATAALRDALDSYSDRHGYYGPEGHVDLPPDQSARDALLAARPIVGPQLPALVTAVGENQATLYLGRERTVELSWDGIKWANRYKDEDHRGPTPKSAGDVLAVGDLVRLREMPGEQGSTWRLTQVPRVAGALVALDSRTGAILALIGGYDFYQSKFNRATQTQRQPGSGFKAFIYSAALENGFTPASIINDAPVVFDDPSLEGAWKPENYSGKFYGPTRLREALYKSRNLISIRVLRAMGVAPALTHIAKFGFDPVQLPHNLSLALGSASVNPLQMARGYAVLANGGYLIEPWFVERIVQNGERVVYQADPPTVCETCPEPGVANAATAPVTAADDIAGAAAAPRVTPAPRVISSQNRYLMYSMMQDVIQRGTGVKARVLGRKDLAGKTGTTNEQRDAWFNGFNQAIVTNVWVGFDDNGKLGRGEVGGRAALPAWIDFMKVALDGTADLPPEIPDGIVTVRIDPQTGLRATAGTPGAIFEVFQEGHTPEAAPQSTGMADFGTAPAPGANTPPAAELF